MTIYITGEVPILCFPYACPSLSTMIFFFNYLLSYPHSQGQVSCRPTGRFILSIRSSHLTILFNPDSYLGIVEHCCLLIKIKNQIITIMMVLILFAGKDPLLDAACQCTAETPKRRCAIHGFLALPLCVTKSLGTQSSPHSPSNE